jgi:hypothetical protein
MILIQNISPVERVVFSTSSDDEAGRPLRIELGPGDAQLIMKEQLRKWPIHAKSRFAELVEHGSLAVLTMNATHVAPDRTKRVTFSSFDLRSCVIDVINFKTEYNIHIASTAFHTLADTTNPITSPDPDLTDPPATQLADVITLLTEAQTDYNAHLLLGASHPFTDLVNDVAVVVPTDLPTSISSLSALVRRLNLHKLHKVTDGSDALTPIEILNFV